MNIVEILSAVGVSGVITGVLALFQDRRIRKATAVASERTTEADYTTKILEQADERVKQALDDRERAFAERDKAYTEAKEQRRAKQEWREKFFCEQEAKHALELERAELNAQLQQERWYRCEKPMCKARRPPRKEAEPEPMH